MKWRDVWPSMVTHTRNLYSAFNPSKCTHTVVNTHTHRVHTPGAVGSQCYRARRAVEGLVPCSNISPQSWYWGWREHWLFTPISKWLDWTKCFGFRGIKKKKEWICIIVRWLCPHTAKTHLYANKDILHPMSSLKLIYYNLNSSDEGLWKSDSNQCWVL